MEILTGKQSRPRRVLLYGPHGVGKSSWAAAAPSPIFLDLEDGLADLDCSKTPVIRHYYDIEKAISFMIENDHQFKTIVIDTLDWMESLIFDYVAREHEKKSIEDIGYGKGYTFALDKWDRILSGLSVLRDKRKMGVVLLSHAKIEKVKQPGMDAFDRYEPSLHTAASRMVQEWCDEVFFANFRTHIRSEDLGFNKSRAIAVGGKDRVICTSNTAACSAKNRLGLPDEIPLVWQEYAKHISRVGNINGIVTNGSSKTKEAVVNG